MSKLKCLFVLVVVIHAAFAQKLSVHLGSAAAKTVVITAEIKDEGSFVLERSSNLPGHWLAFTNFNSFPATNNFSDTRTNKLFAYRVIRLNTPPAITAQPAGATNYVTNQVQLQASATGSWPLRFQWFKDGQAIAGATSNKLVLPGLVASSGNYTLSVSNLWGVEVTTPAAVKVINPVLTNPTGKKIRYVIKAGQGGAASSGTYDTTYSSLGSYSTVSSNVLLNDSGYYTYQYGNNQPLGRFTMSGGFVYPDGTFTDLTFTNETGGTFLLQVPNTAARQSGDFAIIP